MADREPGRNGRVNTADRTLSLSVGKFIGLAELMALYAHDLTAYERCELTRAIRNLDQALAGPPALAERRSPGERRRQR